METMVKIENWLERYLHAESQAELESLRKEMMHMRLTTDELQVLLAIFVGSGFGPVDACIYEELAQRKPLKDIGKWQSWEEFHEDEECQRVMVKYWRKIHDKNRQRKGKRKK